MVTLGDDGAVHATGLVLDGLGILICGPSGAGKSLLALDLMDWADAHAKKALLVGDDRLTLSAVDGALTMTGSTNIAGKIELYGRGIVGRPFCAAAKVDLLVDLVAEMARMPEDTAFVTQIMGVDLARCPVLRRPLGEAIAQRLLVIEALLAL